MLSDAIEITRLRNRTILETRIRIKFALLPKLLAEYKSIVCREALARASSFVFKTNRQDTKTRRNARNPMENKEALTGK
jgi:hypothetical protein